MSVAANWQDAEIRQLRRQIAQIKDSRNHMEACRALLKVPDDDVLYSAIEELLAQIAVKDEALKRLIDAGPKA